ncbi:hypothetical protein V2A60_002406 [Cordyceps javanica]
MELVCMLGNKSKVAALRDLAVAPSSRTQREIHLVAGSLRDPKEQPLLIVETDCLLQNKIPAGPSPPACHEEVRHRLPPAAQAATAGHAADWTISRLALPFAGVVCIFVNDIDGGLRSVARHLASWLADGPPSGSPALPWLLLVNEGSGGGSEKRTVQELRDHLDKICRSGSSLLSRFANVSVAGLGTRSTPHKPPNWQDFRAKLSNSVSGVQKHRKQAGRLFSAQTLCRMMECASSSVSSMPAPLDLASATRMRRPVSQYLEAGVVDFLDRVDSRETLELFAIPVIASSIIFDHHMRNMHLFDIAEVFHQLYRAEIDLASQRLASTSDESRKLVFSSGTDLTSLLAQSLESQFTQFREQRRSALLYHADKLISFRAIVACALAVGKPVDECIKLLEDVARDAFQEREVSMYPFGWTAIGRRFWRFVFTLLMDSKYSPKPLEARLKTEFGESRTLTDRSPATANGLLVGMTMTAVEDTATFVATNQGGAVDPSGEAADFRMLGSPERVLLWQALRASSAAPFYFPPQAIHGVAYQDGGMTYNNPSALALVAAKEQFPEKPDPGLLVSCGAGVEKPGRARSRGTTNIVRTAGGRVEKRRRARPWSRWKLSSVGRVLGAFMSQNDSNREFERVRQHAVHRENFFRLDFEHDGPRPALDDVIDLKARQSWAEESAARSPSIDALALCLRAQHFYFELDDEPMYANRRYKCSGRVLCDLDPGSPEQMLLLDGLDRGGASFRLDGQVLPRDCLGRDARGHDSVVIGHVTFSVDTKQTKFSIEVCEGENRPYGISGSPFTVDWLVQAQGLDDHFGGGY